MKLRTISGTVYVAVLLVFYLLKIFVHPLCFDVLTYAFAVIGTFEMLRAIKEKTTKAQRVIVCIFAFVCIPACAVGETFGYGIATLAICAFVLAIALLSLLVLDHEQTTLENLGVSLFASVYPTVLITILVFVNHIQMPEALAEFAFNSNLLIPLIFAISPLSDVFAYLVGCSLKKVFPAKLAPTISPNKTVVGAIGGLLGGVIASGAVYGIYGAVAGSFADMHIWLPVFLVVGLFGALATEFGDLVESCIKRKLGIKDMGKIMPGHGGILDRVDGTMFTSVVVYLAFELIFRFYM
jgi:phosphatidate cytidylyltransferase